MNNALKVGLAQISPIWLNREATSDKIISFINKASNQGCELVVFGETILPGYPFWIELTDGARFNDDAQKEIFAKYFDEAVSISDGDLDQICAAAQAGNISVVLGIVERPEDRGNHSLYCSMITINNNGKIINNHRKLVPTYEERLVWANGDGHGLKTSKLGSFTMGGLNCWENWMPMARTSLYAQGEDLHLAIWPGQERNTSDITRFIAKEARSYVISVSGHLTKDQLAGNIPHLASIKENASDVLANGGSCVAKPNGDWLLEPQVGSEGLFIVDLDHEEVKKERQNFDSTGHYSRPDVMELNVNRERQKLVKFED